MSKTAQNGGCSQNEQADSKLTSVKPQRPTNVKPQSQNLISVKSQRGTHHPGVGGTKTKMNGQLAEDARFGLGLGLGLGFGLGRPSGERCKGHTN